MSLKSVNVGLLGAGTVGGGTLKVLARNAAEITRRAGRVIRVTHVAALDTSKVRDGDLDGVRLTKQPSEVINDPDIKVVIELMGGTGIAKDSVLAAIRSGKHVITANKALLAMHGTEIFEAAQKQGVIVAFEAAV